MPGYQWEPVAGLDLGGSITDVGTLTAHWVFTSSDDNYYSHEGSVFIIQPAEATCDIIAYDVPFDGSPHTATGSCTGVLDETLTEQSRPFGYHPHRRRSPTWAAPGRSQPTPGGNYNDTSGTVDNNISKVDPAVCTILGWSGPFDGLPSRASGSCDSIGGTPWTEGWTSGSHFTDVPGGNSRFGPSQTSVAITTTKNGSHDHHHRTCRHRDDHYLPHQRGFFRQPD